ncbi:MAG: hypothetical protein IJZ12_01110 [Clostridia bacterium]|nr:hypothetical protein [Clostridia bacterium]
MIVYCVRRDQLRDEDIGRYISFGIDILKDGKPLRVIKDVSPNEKELRKLVSLLNKLQPSLIHIDDIIDDFIN